jgi:hypothetical protein
MFTSQPRYLVFGLKTLPSRIYAVVQSEAATHEGVRSPITT